MCSEKNLKDDQDELKKICQRFAGTTRPLTYLRNNLTVKEFVHVLNFFPDLRVQVDVAAVDDAALNELSGNNEVLIFFGESDLLKDRLSSSKSLWIKNVEFSPTESFSSIFDSESESLQGDKNEIDSKIASTQESFKSSTTNIFKELKNTASQCIDVNEEPSIEVFKSIPNDKTALISPENAPSKPPRMIRKSHKVIFFTMLVVSTILALKCTGFRDR